MKNSDEAIERILAALRETEAPEGIERRILDGVRDNASAQRKRSPMRRIVPSWLIGARSGARSGEWSWAWSWPIAVASMVIVSSAICWTPFRSHPVAHDAAGSNRQIAPAIQLATEKAIQPLSVGSSTRLGRKANRRKENRENIVADSDSVALREMRAASHPAPPMPLTEQEKLLLRIAHKGDPVELAALDPVMRATRDAEEKAEVQKFFEPATGDKE